MQSNLFELPRCEGGKDSENLKEGTHVVGRTACDSLSLRFHCGMNPNLKSQFVNDTGHARIFVESPEDEADVHANAFVVARHIPDIAGH